MSEYEVELQIQDDILEERGLYNPEIVPEIRRLSYKFSEEEIPIDLLQMIVNKSRKYSLIILVNGHGQVGKSTFIYYLANRIMQIKRYGRLEANDPRNTWREWNAYTHSADNAKDFVRIWSENTEDVCVLQECSETLNRYEWWNVMGRVFNSTHTTQGLYHNISILDTVMSTDIMKTAKEKIDFRVAVVKRIDQMRLAKIKNYWVEIDYAKDKWRLRWMHPWDIFYSWRFLLEAQKYTKWLETDLKQRVMLENKMKVGLVERPMQQVLCCDCGSIHAIGECPLKAKDVMIFT